MSLNEITQQQAKQNLKFEVAKQVRQLLDEAKKAYGATDWVEDEVEAELDQLIFGE